MSKLQTKNTVETTHEIETLFSIESKNGTYTYYIDYNREENYYMVFRDEKFRKLTRTLGEALEFIFNKIGTTRLKLI